MYDLDMSAPRQLRRHYLRQWRQYRGYSLRRLADLMESEPGEPITSHSNLARIERMEQPYSQEIMEAAAHALRCEVVDLLTVDPTKDGEVIDLLSIMRRKDPTTLRAIVQGLPDNDTGTDGK